MNGAQAVITGVNQVISFRGTLNHGIQPSTFVAEIIPQVINESNVTIAVKYPDPATAFELKECIIDSSSYSATRSGLISTLYIKDFRWKWAYKRITLLANIRKGNGEIIIDENYVYHQRKMSVRNILDQIEVALGVRIILSATLPVDYYPEIIWDNYPAATALSDLLSPLAVRIVPSYEPNVISIHNAGKGSPLPTDDLESYGTDTNPKEKPRQIRIVSAPVIKTVDVGLVPVIKTSNRIDYADMSDYHPSFGRWGDAVDVSDEIASYPNETGRDLTTQECEFVEQSVFKCYRVTEYSVPHEEKESGRIVPVSFGKVIEGYEDNIRTAYGLRRGMQNFICERSTRTTIEQNNEVTYVLSARPPFVYGAFKHEQETDVDAQAHLTASGNSCDSFKDIDEKTKTWLSYIEPDTNEDNKTWNDRYRRFIVPVPFSIDFDAGLVQFSRKVFLERDGEPYFPELCLRIAVKTINEKGTFNRLEHVIQVDPNSPADEIYIELNDVVPMWEYADGFKNRDNYMKQLSDYGSQVLASLLLPDEAGTATYAGVKKIDLDGAIQSVSWSIGQGGARTSATWNHDTGTDTTLSFLARQQAIEVGKAIRVNDLFNNEQNRSKIGLPPL
jgi:hypothetical protein